MKMHFTSTLADGHLAAPSFPAIQAPHDFQPLLIQNSSIPSSCLLLAPVWLICQDIKSKCVLYFYGHKPQVEEMPTGGHGISLLLSSSSRFTKEMMS